MTEKDSDKLKKIIGRNLRNERIKRQLSLETVSATIDISPGFLGLVERGERSFEREKLSEALLLYGTNLDKFIENLKNECEIECDIYEFLDKNADKFVRAIASRGEHSNDLLNSISKEGDINIEKFYGNNKNNSERSIHNPQPVTYNTERKNSSTIKFSDAGIAIPYKYSKNDAETNNLLTNNLLNNSFLTEIHKNPTEEDYYYKEKVLEEIIILEESETIKGYSEEGINLYKNQDYDEDEEYYDDEDYEDEDYYDDEEDYDEDYEDEDYYDDEEDEVKVRIDEYNGKTYEYDEKYLTENDKISLTLIIERLKALDKGEDLDFERSDVDKETVQRFNKEFMDSFKDLDGISLEENLNEYKVEALMTSLLELSDAELDFFMAIIKSFETLKEATSYQDRAFGNIEKFLGLGVEAFVKSATDNIKESSKTSNRVSNKFFKPDFSTAFADVSKKYPASTFRFVETNLIDDTEDELQVYYDEDEEDDEDFICENFSDIAHEISLESILEEYDDDDE